MNWEHGLRSKKNKAALRGRAWTRPARRPRAPAQRESSIEESCRKLALKIGWVSRKMNGFGFRSWPDRFFLPRARMRVARGAIAILSHRFWVEFKKPGEEPTPDQDRIINDLRSRGETVYVIDNKKEFARVLEKHDAAR